MDYSFMLPSPRLFTQMWYVGARLWGKMEIDPLDIATTFYKHHTEMWKNSHYFYDDSMLWVMVYNKLVPKIKKHIDFIMQPKLKNKVSSPEV